MKWENRHINLKKIKKPFSPEAKIPVQLLASLPPLTYLKSLAKEGKDQVKSS